MANDVVDENEFVMMPQDAQGWAASATVILYAMWLEAGILPRWLPEEVLQYPGVVHCIRDCRAAIVAAHEQIYRLATLLEEIGQGMVQ